MLIIKLKSKSTFNTLATLLLSILEKKSMGADNTSTLFKFHKIPGPALLAPAQRFAAGGAIDS
jgi:hypothetical protein